MRKVCMYSFSALLVLSACSGVQLSPQAQRAADVFSCSVASVAPYVGDALDAVDLVREAIKGRADLEQALALLGSTPEDIREVKAALAACRSEPPAAPLEPEPVEWRVAGSP
jgi:hypothetical protein